MSDLLTGQLVNFSKLATEAEVTIPTAQKFIGYMEISYALTSPSLKQSIS